MCARAERSGFFQREKFEVLVELKDSLATAAAQSSLLDLAEMANKEDVADIATTQREDVAVPKVDKSHVERSKVESATAEKIKPDSEPRISTETESFAEVLSRVAFQAHSDELTHELKHEQPLIPDRPAFLDTFPDKVSVDPEPQAVNPAPLPEVIVPKHRTHVGDHPLAALGLPTEFIPVGVAIDKLQEALTSALERLLPRVPHVRPSKGSVVAVVGERFEAMEMAQSLAAQWGRPDEDIVLASQNYRGKGAANVLRTVRSAEDAHRSWSHRARPTIVAIDAQPGSV